MSPLLERDISADEENKPADLAILFLIEESREGITEKDSLTEEAQRELLITGPSSVYSRASGNTPGY